MREEASDDPVVALHRVEVAVPVATADGHPGHEVVQDEVVEDDDAGAAAERVDDPRVRVGVVADVVEAEVCPARRALPPVRLHDEVDPPPEGRDEERRVVGDPRPLRRHRRVVRDPHARSLSTARLQVTSSAIAFPALPNDAASSRWARSQPAARASSSAAGGTTSPVRSVADDLERAPGVRRRQHRLLGEERLERDHPEVLVHRGVEDREAAAVEVGELLLGHASGEPRATVERASAGERLEPRAVRTVADDHDLERGVEGGGLEQEVDALRPVEAVDGEHEVAVRLAPVRELLRRVREHLGHETRATLEPVGDVARGREEPRGLAERDAVERLHLPPRRPVLGGAPPNCPSSVPSSS